MSSNALPLYVDLLTASELICTSPESIKYWIRAGKLPCRKPGKRILIETAALLAYIASADPSAKEGAK